MPELIRPSKVSILTKDGECEIHLTIDININMNAVGETKSISSPALQEEDEKTIWAIPSFKSQDKIKFGNKKEK